MSMSGLNRFLTPPVRRNLLLVAALLLALYNTPFTKDIVAKWLENSFFGISVLTVLAVLTMYMVFLVWNRDL